MTMAELTRGVSKVLIEEDAVAARVAELGAEVSADYAARISCSSACSRARSSSWPT
jgi:hypoxanthine-guanine phosphoribosyltransferase